MNDTFNSSGLLDYQVPIAMRLYKSMQETQALLDASDTGIGKTYTACAFIREFVEKEEARFFVVCPKPVKHEWRQASNHFGISPLGVVNFEKIIRGGTPFAKWVSVLKTTTKRKNGETVEEVRDEGYFKWTLPLNTIIVFDEVHKCKGENSQNGMILRAAKEQGYRIHMMSATAATNPMEMFSLGYVLGLHQGEKGSRRAFKEWCIDYGAKWTGKFGTQSFDPKDDASSKAMMALHHELTETNKMVRVTRKQLGLSFPESVISADAIDCGEVETNKINKIYDSMQYELDQLDEKSADYKFHAFSIMTKARRKAELYKVPAFVEMAAEQVSENKKSVLIFVNYQDTVTALTKRLKNFRVSYIIGGQTEKERDQEIANFQDGTSEIIIVNIAAGSSGISLHDLTGEHERYSIISPCFSAIQMVQALGRPWRKGGGFSRQCICFAAQTVEETACERVRSKIQNMTIFNDGSLQDSDLIF